MTKQAISVSALTRYLKFKFDQDPHLLNITIKGEISNLKFHNSGNIYFSLKDSSSKIDGVMYRSDAYRLQLDLKEGMEVIVTGSISIYQQRGIYQMTASTIEPDGMGALFLQLEQLKKKLQSEGLFDSSLKQVLPRYPSTIALITSPKSAAVEDMIKTIHRRNPSVAIHVFPAIVQGDAAPKSIVRAIDQANQLNEADVLIVGRGGGSIEELWAFNDESVIRSIVNSKIPVISAVGHETDITLSDFGADVRASTPTGAAELAVQEYSYIEETIFLAKQTIETKTKMKLKHLKYHIHSLERSAPLQNPKRLIQAHQQTLDYFQSDLDRQIVSLMKQKAYKLNQFDVASQSRTVKDRLKNEREKLSGQLNLLGDKMNQLLENRRQSLQIHLERMLLLNPLAILSRGYALPYDENDRLVKSVKEIKREEKMRIKVVDGHINAIVEQIEEDHHDE